mmetsp:Transcript_74710/g.167502  ORF Transcript_74710/g.167502 Transcript_74710/m.167502 type:complete len:243 (+) Transcript_74710:982-1710(+)
MTTLRRRPLPFAIQRPITSSVSPSGNFSSEGMGYCSAVSMRFTPLPRMALSMKALQRASSGALKSVEHQRCVPKPSSETMISLPPRRFCLMPPTTATTSFVGFFWPLSLALATPAAALPGDAASSALAGPPLLLATPAPRPRARRRGKCPPASSRIRPCGMHGSSGQSPSAAATARRRRRRRATVAAWVVPAATSKERPCAQQRRPSSPWDPRNAGRHGAGAKLLGADHGASMAAITTSASA